MSDGENNPGNDQEIQEKDDKIQGKDQEIQKQDQEIQEKTKKFLDFEPALASPEAKRGSKRYKAVASEQVQEEKP